ncbi:MAG: aminotransferase class I/II-fold pyridoxal phosphate-dependent enzyme [Phycisphaerales bacterium]|nr:aminotransferase class I/II-fold pyridoxal phosphate-dependent enzyme [Phycisphaerales bacterium]
MVNAQKHIRGKTAATIADSIEQAIRENKLNPGQKLPPVRALAQTLGISPATVAASYQSLHSRGVLVAKGRRGTMVSHRPLHGARRPMAIPPGVRDLYDGNPDPALLPPLSQVLGKIDTSFHLYGQSQEYDKLVRLAVRDFAADGVAPGRICVMNGALDGIERILTEHLRPGDRVAVEDPGFGSIFDLVMSLGHSLVPVSVDEEGIVPSDLERACREGAKALITSPRSQNPTGSALTETRARELRRVLRKAPDLISIEDDHANLITDAPLHCIHDSKRPRWVYIRSLSKAINPDLRLALMTGDETTISRVQDRLIVGGRWVSHVLQRIAYVMLSSSSIRKHLRTVAKTYTQRRQALIDALANVGITAMGRTGFNVWLPVTEETTTVQALLEAGWAVSAGERFRLNSPPAIRITTATLSPSEALRFASDLSNVQNRSVHTTTV